MRVVLTASAQKKFQRLPKQEQKKIARKLIILGNNPYLGKKLSGELEGFYVIRAWPYRILYEIGKYKKEIIVNSIQHRQGVYK